jgi:hypothetical protein
LLWLLIWESIRRPIMPNPIIATLIAMITP